ncbi:MAG: hypothetical protein AABY80_09635, partial [Candidatus Deferrimicrobiota bacterium]
LEKQPELLFKMRKVDEKYLIATAAGGLPLSKKGPAEDKVLAAEGLSDLFGLEIAATGEDPAPESAEEPARPARRRRAAKASADAENTVPAARTTKTRGRKSSSSVKRKTSRSRARPKTWKRSTAKR